ncbi:10 kDa heat shock protein, mitochondrial [Musca vetustissima]|uniref:10 kDa heat shock protein, mitochondrial n=1 Tax=Musca domestica TaxID=7370 RepID=A0A1Y9TFC2_MUSDO|nr:10 kDa heat shock protein, mitochondrial [Musca vetustissima]AQY54358.1 heat shock protein 10 [Musca domestica]
MSAIKRIIPMLDRVLVKRAETLTTTKGGIVLPEKAQGKMMEGTVIAVGPGARNAQTGEHIKPAVKEGDRILLPEFGGTKVEMEDKKEYLLFRESDILAKLE